MQLYQKLCHALDANEINELGLLPMVPEISDVPPESQMYHPLIVVENKLGIAKQCLSVLLKQAHEHFVALDKNDQLHLEQASRVMILLKPDNYTAMNQRKRLIQSKYVRPQDEIALLELIFTIPKHSKSSIAWYHRQWIFAHYAELDVDKEFRLCTMTSMLYPRNYYAWTYRHWVLSVYCASDPAKVQQEYTSTCQWIERNISDFSGFQYLQQVMEMHADIPRASHMQWLDTLIVRYPGHESLWCHRRFCSHLFARSEAHCHEQHAFVENIMRDVYKDQSLSLDNMHLQKEFALKFGLFHLIMEKQVHGRLFADTSTASLYLSAAPTPHFMDLQGEETKKKGNFECN